MTNPSPASTSDLQTTTPVVPPPDHPVATLNRRWRDAFNAGDVPTLMAMYEPDAVLVPGPGASPLRGHAAIEEGLRGFLALGGRLTFTPRFWLLAGEVALGSIAFTLEGGHAPDGTPAPLAGVTTEVVRQCGGTWRYVLDHPFGGA